MLYLARCAPIALASQDTPKFARSNMMDYISVIIASVPMGYRLRSKTLRLGYVLRSKTQRMAYRLSFRAQTRDLDSDYKPSDWDTFSVLKPN